MSCNNFHGWSLWNNDRNLSKKQWLGFWNKGRRNKLLKCHHKIWIFDWPGFTLSIALHPLVGIMKNLPGRSINIIKAYSEVEGCIQDMQHMRQTIGEEFHKIYKQAERFAEKLHVEPIIPRSAVRQMHRKNVPVKNPEEYYRKALVIPLVDRFIAEMTFRFNSFNKTASKLLLLVLVPRIQRLRQWRTENNTLMTCLNLKSLI